jgi:hypothetical protein
MPIDNTIRDHKAWLGYVQQEGLVMPTAIAAAEELANDCGYHRRDKELADAKRALISRSETDSP